MTFISLPLETDFTVIEATSATTLIEIENWNIKPQSGIFLIGKNGTGKSALFKALCGFSSFLTRPKLGKFKKFVYLEAELLSGVDDATRVEDLLRLMTGHTRRELLSALSDLMKQESIAGSLFTAIKKGRRLAEFSSGERQLLALLGALLARPKFLILDESLTSMDPIQKERAFSLIHRLVAVAKEKEGAAFATAHDRDVVTRVIEIFAQHLETRLFVLDNNRMREVPHDQDFSTYEKFRSTYES